MLAIPLALLLLFLVLVLVAPGKLPSAGLFLLPLPSVSMEYVPESRTIFVSLASYRDSLCSQTLLDLFAKASAPERVFVGIFQQNDPSPNSTDVDCCHQLLLSPSPSPSPTGTFPRSRWMENVRITRVGHLDALGPQSARHRCAAMHAGEDFFLQLDSHMSFVTGWDAALIEMYDRIAAAADPMTEDDDPRRHYDSSLASTDPWLFVDRRKIVISAYPLGMEYESRGVDEGARLTTAMCGAMFNADGIIQPLSSVLTAADEHQLRPTPFIAAGFMFGPSSMLADVPYDDALPFLFHGEELLYSVRLFEQGYRVFSPFRNIVFHHYVRGAHPKVWEDHPDFFRLNKQSTEAVKQTLLLLLLQPPPPLGAFGASSSPLPTEGMRYPVSRRAALAFYEHFGIHMHNRTFTRHC